MSKITIFNATSEELFTHECEGNTIEITIEEAVKQGVNLTPEILRSIEGSSEESEVVYVSYPYQLNHEHCFLYQR
jgi:hypothetical protein